MYLKVKCGSEVRKCAVEAEGLSYADLQQKVVQLFPALREQKAESPQLAYRDNDGDLICLSSDDELRAAVGQVQGDTLILVVTGVVKTLVETPTEQEDEEEDVGLADLFLGGDLFSGLLNPSVFPFHHLHGGGLSPFHQLSLFESPAAFRDRVLRAREEELRQQRKYEEKMHQAQLERRKALLEQAKQMHKERQKEINENRRKSQDLQHTSSKEAGKVPATPPVPKFPPGWIVKPIGSWDPIMMEGPGFYSTTHGPYGYYAYHAPEAMETDMTKEKPEEPAKKTEEPAKKSDKSAMEQEQA